MDFLQISGKRFLIFGVANKKSVAYAVASMLRQQGGQCVFVVRDEEVLAKTQKLFPDASFFCCNVEHEEDIIALREAVGKQYDRFDGILHSIAFADFSEGLKPFHETPKKAFFQALDISCFSFVSISRYFADLLADNASVVTVSISTTRMANESYGYMAPIKAALDSSLAFLSKSFSSFSHIRFNAVAPGPLKTSASAGIPGYLDSYLYTEKVVPRGKAVATDEAAAVAVFLLSPLSSGIVAQKIVVDAGMEINYFDKNIIKATVE
ncbi:MAG: SDR family oxidoreductase [Thermoguttaceae bacterium]|nr:SDR family oxidoreductase [Thermoguttaceae bacterium]